MYIINMKKLLILLGLIICVFTSNAQIINFLTLNSDTVITPPVQVNSINIVFDGDSETDLNIYPPLLVTQLRDAGYSVSYNNIAVGGRTSIDMLANVSNVLAGHNSNVDLNLLIYWIGTNDAYLNQNLVNIDSNLVVYYNTVKTDFKVMQIGTTDLINDTFSQQIDSMYVANWAGNYSDNFLDLLTDARYQDASNTTYFYDGVHMTTSGYQGVADLVYPKIIEIINSL